MTRQDDAYLVPVPARPQGREPGVGAWLRCSFCQKDKVEDSKPYLYAGIAGFVVGLVLNFITMSFMQ